MVRSIEVTLLSIASRAVVESADTVTASAIACGRSWTRTVSAGSVSTRSAGANPGADTRTATVCAPAFTLTVQVPSAAETTSCRLSAAVTVTAAPATTAPLGSVTTPESDAGCWPSAKRSRNTIICLDSL